MIPIFYSIRNLMRRPDQSCLLISGCAVVITLIMTAAAMNQAMEQTLRKTGDPFNGIFLGAGSEESVERSEVKLSTGEIIASSISGIKKIMDKPSVSPEIHFNGMIGIPNSISSQALIRGVNYEALWVHNKVRMIKGRFPRSGEVMVGKLTHQKLNIEDSELQIGKIIIFNEQNFIISGIFDAVGSAMEAEVWMPLQDLLTHTQRTNISCVVVKMQDESIYGDLDAFAMRRLDLELIVIRESDYYSKLSIFYAPIRWMAWICAILLSLGAVLGGLNAMYATFSSRIREFGAMQAIGFTRTKIFISLIQESCFSALIGTLIAYVIVLIILQDIAVPFSIGVFVLDFKENILILGISTSLILGFIGGIPPAWKVLTPSLIKTLR